MLCERGELLSNLTKGVLCQNNTRHETAVLRSVTLQSPREKYKILNLKIKIQDIRLKIKECRYNKI